MTTLACAVDTQKLRVLIAMAGITYETLAEAAGLTERTILRILKSGTCTSRSIDHIACYFGRHMSEFQTDRQEMTA